MAYTRQNPSPEFTELVELYKQLHRDGDPANGILPGSTFDGRSLLPHGGTIKEMIDRHGAATIMDYGAGKGRQYGKFRIAFDDGRTFDSIAEYWGVSVTCYDPGWPPHSTLPAGRFDGVVCTDVLEHCPEADMPWIVEELFGYAAKFLFATVALYPARKTLPDGRNAHITLQPADWWQSCINAVAANHTGIRYRLVLMKAASGDPADMAVIEG
jgi:hypothetical protein